MQNTPIRTTGPQWDFLEPAMNPNYARTDHGLLLKPTTGNYIYYPKGQIVMQKNDGTNEWAKIGTSGYGGPARIMKYSILMNDAGQYQMTYDQVWNVLKPTFDSGSIDFYYQGYFKTQDLIGAGGTNEVQTETLDAGVDGGTRTLKFGPYTTAPIAWNASAATIKAAMLAAMPNLTTADITVAGSGPYTYTFSGAYAGANVPLLQVDPALLTDGGVAPATTGSVIAETTPGAGLLTGVGRLIRGTSAAGIMQLGVGAPS